MVSQDKEIFEEPDLRKRLELYMNRYGLEVIIILVLAISGSNYLYGRHKNNQLAQKWLLTLGECLQKEFPKHTTIEFDDSTVNSHTVILSGRANMHYCNIVLGLQSRHILSKNLLRPFSSAGRERDTMLIEIPIKRPDVVHSEILLA